jgi:hypothetical protein
MGLVQSFTLPHHFLWTPGPFLLFLSIPRSLWGVLFYSYPIPTPFLLYFQSIPSPFPEGENMRECKGKGGGSECEGGQMGDK